MSMAKSELEMMEEMTAYFNRMEDDMAKLRAEMEFLKQENKAFVGHIVLQTVCHWPSSPRPPINRVKLQLQETENELTDANTQLAAKEEQLAQERFANEYLRKQVWVSPRKPCPSR